MELSIELISGKPFLDLRPVMNHMLEYIRSGHKEDSINIKLAFIRRFISTAKKMDVLENVTK